GGLLDGIRGGNNFDFNSEEEGPCYLYPAVPCLDFGNQAAAIMTAWPTFLQSITKLLSTNQIDETIQEFTSTEAHIVVLLLINDQTQEIEIIRPDIIEALASGELNYTQTENLRKLLDETALLFADDSSVLYSNGLYSPPVENGVSVDKNAPRY